MGITRSLLLDSHEGAVMDVLNDYIYGRTTGKVWDNP
jgi:hypothetical protein